MPCREIPKGARSAQAAWVVAALRTIALFQGSIPVGGGTMRTVAFAVPPGV